jgi:flagellar export protein FliJ
LQQREREEQAAQLALHQAAQAYMHAQAEAARLHAALEEERRSHATPGGPFEMDRRMYLLLHLDRAARELAQQQQVVQQQAQSLERARDLLTRAAARKRTLERLRERQREEYTRQEERRLNQELDEHGALRFARLPQEERR